MLLSLLCAILVAFELDVHGTPTAVDQDSSLVIQLETGSFQGARAENGTERWLGIPYAEPPLADLRFKAPVPLRRSANAGIKNASQFGNACPQPPFFTAINAPISEDCLMLNVCLSFTSSENLGSNGYDAHIKDMETNGNVKYREFTYTSLDIRECAECSLVLR